MSLNVGSFETDRYMDSPGTVDTWTPPDPSAARAVMLVQDTATYDLVEYGARQTWPEFYLENKGPVHKQDANHSCASASVIQDIFTPGYRSIDGSEDQDPEPCEACIDCSTKGRRSAMHSLACGHHLCRYCLRQRAMCIETRSHLGNGLHQVAAQLYSPYADKYARTWEEKDEVLLGLWGRAGWTCCNRVIPFADIGRREGCLLEPHMRILHTLWNNMIYEIQSEGDAIILWYLDKYMEFDIILGEEVALCTYPGLPIQIKSPFLRLPEDPDELFKWFPRLATQRKNRKYNLCMKYVLEPAPPRDHGPAKPPTEEQKRRLGWLWSGVPVRRHGSMRSTWFNEAWRLAVQPRGSVPEPGS